MRRSRTASWPGHRGARLASLATLLGAVALSALTLPAEARPVREGRDRRHSEPRSGGLWESVVGSGLRTYRRALGRGQQLYEAARGMDSRATPELVEETLRDALAAFDEACRSAPGETEAQLGRADVLFDLGRMKEAAAAFQRYRRLAASSEIDEGHIAFRLGVAYSKLGDFEQAVREYERVDRAVEARASPPEARQIQAVARTNAAEALMALGRLEEAIQRYEDALALNPGDPVLTLWGLAVALDRDEQVGRAAEVTLAALARDRNMQRLGGSSVFFIPEGDIHYYYALGLLAKGGLDASRREWELFLEKVPTSPWAQRARAHLARLDSMRKGGGARKRLAPFPGPNSSADDDAARDEMIVRMRLQASLHGVRRCYQTHLRRQPGLAGRLRVAILVQTDGRIADARVLESTLPRSGLPQCVTAALRAVRCDKLISRRPVRVVHAFDFKPGFTPGTK